MNWMRVLSLPSRCDSPVSLRWSESSPRLRNEIWRPLSLIYIRPICVIMLYPTTFLDVTVATRLYSERKKSRGGWAIVFAGRCFSEAFTTKCYIGLLNRCCGGRLQTCRGANADDASRGAPFNGRVDNGLTENEARRTRCFRTHFQASEHLLFLLYILSNNARMQIFECKVFDYTWREDAARVLPKTECCEAFAKAKPLLYSSMFGKSHIAAYNYFSGAHRWILSCEGCPELEIMAMTLRGLALMFMSCINSWMQHWL